MAAEPPSLFLLRTAPGLAMLWAGEPPEAGGKQDALLLRGAAFRKGCVPVGAAGPPLSGEAESSHAPLREVTLTAVERLSAEALRTVVRAVAGWPGSPLIRLELDAEALARRPLTRAEARAWRRCGVGWAHLFFRHLEIFPGLAELLGLLAGAGFPLAGEILLERGVNDDPERLRTFLPELLRCGVRPYYLVTGAWMPPGARVPEERALEIVKALRGWISGLAVPQLVYESASGTRTVLVPSYLEALDEEGAILSDYRGERRFYPHLPHKDD